MQADIHKFVEECGFSLETHARMWISSVSLCKNVDTLSILRKRRNYNGLYDYISWEKSIL